MPEYLHPGVYIEEIERGPRPIEGVPTSTAAFLGEAERGSITPRLVTSYTEYQRWFGDVFGQDKFLPYTVNGFFENDGKRGFVCRLVGAGASTAQASFGDFILRAAGPGSWGTRVFVKIEDSTTKKADGSSVGFRLRLAYWSAPGVPFDPFSTQGGTALPGPALVEDFDDLVPDESSPDFYGKRVPESSALGMLVRNVGAPAGARPGNGTQTLSGGADDPAALGVDDYTGRPAGSRTVEQGLAALELDPYRDVALVYAPLVSTAIAKAIVAHCEASRFRFAVIDSDKGQSGANTLNPRDTISDSSYAGFYYPWIIAADPRTGAPTLIPPGGHVLGVYARSDTERGVFKAPANEIVRGALGLEYEIDDLAQDELNPKGVNVVRSFPGRGIRVWGARTITSDALWKYVSVRRLFIFLERSIYEGTRWVVFEPNDDRLWARVTDTIRLFLRGQWRLGALAGRTEQEAFFIACDRSTMSQDDILNGRLICEIGVAPVRPAEFVIFRLLQNTAEAQRQEPRMGRIDPYRNFRFRLEIDGISQAGFSELAIADTTIDAVDYREGTDPSHVRKLPGLTKYGNITLKRGLAIGTAPLDLVKWHAGDSTGQVKIKRKEVVIVVQDEAGGEAARFVVTGAWPVKYDPSDLNAKGNEVVIELLELANEGIERVS